MSGPDNRDSPETPRAAPAWRSRVWALVKWLLFAVIVVFVAQRGRQIWETGSGQALEIRYGWLVAAGGAYLAGWLPCAWFWRRLMRTFDCRVSLFDAVRAHYCGQAGKYVPGKAMVLLIRAGMLQRRGCTPAIGALTAGYETLSTIGAGAAIAVALSPIASSETLWQYLPGWLEGLRKEPVWAPLAVLAVVVALLPLVSRLFNSVALHMLPDEMQREDRDVRIKTRLLAEGLLVGASSWALHGLSLGLTLHSVSPDGLDLRQWPMWSAAAAAATVIGFLTIVAPGGLVVRELVLAEVLQTQPGIGAQQAVAAALLLRAVWFVAEIVSGGALYWLAALPPLRRREHVH